MTGPLGQFSAARKLDGCRFATIEETILDADLPPEQPFGKIRPYEARDREAVRDVCRRTAYRNRGAQSVFEDGELFADYWCNYYTDFEPESCLVVEEQGEVIGYFFGCVDTRRFLRVMKRRIVPLLLLRLLARYATLQYKQKTTRRMIQWFLLHSWHESPSVSIEQYPSHYHCNILRKGHGKAYYTTMTIMFVDRLTRMGGSAMHGQVLEPSAGGGWLRLLKAYRQPGLIQHYSEKPSSFHRIVLGENTAMVNRAWGMQLEPLRAWLVWVGDKYRI
jgi:hypothetical protein